VSDSSALFCKYSIKNSKNI